MNRSGTGRDDLLLEIRRNGVAGAGGGGFPTHVKLNCRVDTVIANGAECEPLLWKDKTLMAQHPDIIIRGLMIAMEITGSGTGIIGLKKKATQAVDALSGHIQKPIRLHLLDDTYPSGDEFVLTYETTGRVPPPGGLPLDVGVVMLNVETLFWIGSSRPVTHKWVTVAGAVPAPKTLVVPIGYPVRAALAACGWEPDQGTRVLEGGVMMGRLLPDLDGPITKITNGLIVLPRDHHLIQRYERPRRTVSRIARSACDQCNFCTQLCPRYLLGHPVEPHLAMRHIAMAPENSLPPTGSLYCCGCMLCSLWSCPEDLDPGAITFDYRRILSENKTSTRLKAREPHLLYRYRRPTLSGLKRRLGLACYADAAFPVEHLTHETVSIPLKQHAGIPAEPVVSPGDRVKMGAIIGDIPDGGMGASVHASIDGVVQAVSSRITIQGDNR
ncbi:SLBB domain-containing protein [bacterium]|nr:SLBB domain-containing protein [candidate division CSSED10-310 bacterium]